MDVAKAVETAKRHYAAVSRGEDITGMHVEEACYFSDRAAWRVTLAVTRKTDPSETLGLQDQTHTEYKVIEIPENDPDHASITTRDTAPQKPRAE